MTKPFMAEAGGRAETADRKGKKIEKLCRTCGCGIERRKTYCGPCYDLRLTVTIARNRK